MTKRPRRQTGESAALRTLDTVRLSAESAAMATLGALEATVIEALWDLGRPVRATELHRRVLETHRCALLSTITVANRMVRKGLLRREKVDDVFHYSPIYGRETFTTLVSRHVVEGILSVGSDAIAASFVDVLAEREPRQLAELGRLVRRRLKEREDSKQRVDRKQREDNR